MELYDRHFFHSMEMYDNDCFDSMEWYDKIFYDDFCMKLNFWLSKTMKKN